MNSKKLSLSILIFLASLLILSGCSNAGISLNLEPNPVRFSSDQTKKEITLEVKTEGIGNIDLNKMIIEIIDQNGEIIFTDKKDINITDQFIIGGLSETENYTLDLEKIFDPTKYGYTSNVDFLVFYNEVLKGRSHSLNITVTGSNTTSLKTEVIYE
ncbi:hypothetical protein C7957_103146 [Halanaerobium saccharolyticum]|uniref:Uncharacterized protein n=1 Tax=Halanaerobium saccharolyticum TaxID=43595 RepID=A0A4R6SL95_9FIRM|nr:hypothetical protein [Halanaerobium saccharolyticum]TDQ01739.1 hypothetical protein C7957_103146 [Halanaerobium saccharolyticum]